MPNHEFFCSQKGQLDTRECKDLVFKEIEIDLDLKANYDSFPLN